jgi:hypothetical protein
MMRKMARLVYLCLLLLACQSVVAQILTGYINVKKKLSKQQ